jgi:predicted DNA-binding transcriptional regulator AlpA
MTGIKVSEVKRRRGRPAKQDAHVVDAGRDQTNHRVELHEELLTTTEAAALTKMSKSWFEKQRWSRSGPPFRKRGKAVRYLKSELIRWFTELRATDFGGVG